MTSHSYEIALFGEFLKGDLKPVLNRIALHSESAHQMHSFRGSAGANLEPALLRAKKELVLYSYWKPESARIHPEATVRPWATVQVVGDALGFASAWATCTKRSPIYRRGYVFLRGRLIIQIFQEEQVCPLSIPSLKVLRGHMSSRLMRRHRNQYLHMRYALAGSSEDCQPGARNTGLPLGRHIEAVLEVQALMKGLIDLRRQDV
ncbi:hypothetical protein EI94DRAFT_1718211 [Lactarius quietus]|nr:hypothetical protein EI94DRAFT_1718211 [Lactarius quietus]